ncbi:single-stranded-DNA-specific exonuclease RecJ [Neobacillus vireti]|uniref:single-stranded-DNA-specific exonuclease RecJ n=1 Tax=Neobacillus vireti TaxID=220686 RepID=UPI002FFDFDAD
MHDSKWYPHQPTIENHPQKNWIYYLSRRFIIDPNLMFWLFLQGYNTEHKIENLFFPSTESFHDPFLLNDMEVAVTRILKAIHNNEKIMIFGDYDADGITSTTLLYKGLKEVNSNVNFRLPLREEGYGISAAAVEQIAAQDFGLIITVDNGSSAHPAMKKAKEKGIDIIVTDHHDILGEYPDCLAFINPKRQDSTYPFNDLCGAGVALKLMEAIFKTLKRNWYYEMGDYIELATIGTIADLVSLTNENRAICHVGLKKMNMSPQSILQRMFQVLKLSYIDSSSIGFQIGPILNSVGRVDNPNIAVSILCNSQTSENEIRNLIAYNQKRKDMTIEQYMNAEKQIIEYQLNKEQVIVVYGDFNKGIIGIIASRISEKYKKPSIVISSCGTASCRGVNGTDFSMINTLTRCSHFFDKYGGHKAAAGFSINPEVIDSFKIAVQHSAEKEGLKIPVKQFLCLLPISTYNHEFTKDLQAIEPFGMGFPKPLFYSGRLKITSAQTFGQNNAHLSFAIGKNRVFAFSKGEYANRIINKEMGFLYSVQNNYFSAEDIKYIN